MVGSTTRILRVPLFVAALSAATSAAASWTSESIAGGRHFQGDSSVVVDAAGQSIIAYAGDALRVARWDGSAW